MLFGSNLGTAEGIATRLAQEGTERGYNVTLGSLDDYVDRVPAKGAIIVCASYNGLPPDNAVKFHHLLNEAGPSAYQDLSYTVFGCGNTEWATTYQAVPTQLDAGLEQHGGTRIHPRGAGDARGDFDAAYRNWHDTLWQDIAAALGVDATHETDDGQPRLAITVTNRQVFNPVIMSYQARAATVRDNHELLGEGAGRSTRHLEVALPSGTSYQAGDHLGVLPRNNINLIRRVMVRFGLDAGSYVTIIPNRGSHTHLPTDEPAPLLGVLGSCVELQDPATRGDIEMMASYTTDPGQRASLEGLVGTDDESQTRFRNEVLARGRSLLDLLERLPGLRHAVRGLPRPPATAAAPLLLHLLLTDGEPGCLQRHHWCTAWSGPFGSRRIRWGVLELSGMERAEQHSVRLCAGAYDRFPTTGEPAHTDDHDRSRHRAGAVPRLPPGAGRAQGPRECRSPPRCSSSAAGRPRMTISTKTSCAHLRLTA